MGNRPEWVTSAFAISLVGGVIVPVNTFATGAERDYILRHSDASLLLLQSSLLRHDFLEDLLRDHPEIARGEPGRVYCPALPQLRGAFCLGLDQARGGVVPWSALAARAATVPEDLLDAAAEEIAPSDDALIIYTSGTTAHPKGVVHRQRAPVIQSYRFAEYMELTPEDVVLTAQPFFWTAGIAMSLGATLAAGARLVLQETFDAESALDAIERERVTAVFAWPHQEKAMAEHVSAAGRDLSSATKLESSSPLAPLAGVEGDTWSTYSSYGATETFTLSSALPAGAPSAERRAANGRPLPGMSIRIVDPESGEPLATGKDGEIAVKGVTFMAGYHKVDPELYMDADGFFRTQDGGSLDADGYLHWTGRLSNLIKTGGANVSPLEIEEALTRYPGLRAGLAVGVPHPTLGEAIVLCAVVSDGTALDTVALLAHLKQKLAAYKLPKHVLLFGADELSFTGTQKIQTAPLREAALKRLTEQGVEIDGHSYRGTGDG
jgi:fatty-acyl-CoA synthase